MSARGRGGRRGSARSRGRARGGNPAPRPRRVCEHFLVGRCSFGSSCRFSHDPEVPTGGEELSTESLGLTAARDVEARENYIDFKRMIRRHSAQLGSLRKQDCLQAWALANAVMGAKNRELHQSIARDLADDDLGGPTLIQNTVRLCLHEPNDAQCIDLSRAFLETITNTSLLRCLSIDAFVGTIYRVLAGSGGGQAIAYLTNVSRRLTPGSQSPKTSLALIVSSLFELLSRERKGLLHHDLPSLLTILEDKVMQLASLDDDENADSRNIDTSMRQLDMMRRMMDAVRGPLAGHDMESAQHTAARDATTIRSTFPMDIVVPGGKHDNDFADVTKIQIFPTLGEVLTSEMSEYLPTTDFTQPHFLADPVQRHLDSAFRLLRHDIFGPLKDIIGSVLAHTNVAIAATSNPFIGGNMRAHFYQRANIQHLFVKPKVGLGAVLSFSQPPQIRSHSSSERRHWWQESSRLEPGGLVCFVTMRGAESCFLLFVVTEKNTEDVSEGEIKTTLVSSHSRPAITARLCSETQQNLLMMSRLYIEKQTGLLIDLPGLIPETFIPILENLQRMMRDGDLAFRQWILPPTSGSDAQGPSMPPPAYARHGFRFRLSSIAREGFTDLTFDPTNPDGISLDRLESATGLDRGQSESLIAALSREYVLIQGPPGTGKSYVGVQLVRVLLDHKAQANLGPIFVICYTNHALDQFLRHFLDVGVTKIIRIGGRSRAEELDGKNLRVVSRTVPKTKVEDQILGRNYAKMDDCLQRAGAWMKHLHHARKARLDFATLLPFLRRHYPSIAAQFNGQDENEFTHVGNNPMEIWLGKRGNANRRRMEEVEHPYDLAELTLRAEQSVHDLTKGERLALAESWASTAIQDASESIFELLDQARCHREEIGSVHADVSRRAVLQADVVGVTTTGLARNIKMLRRAGAKVILCEEAAEVMEPHLVSALMPGVEHFVQIGDHRQLRPQIQNYPQFSLETSAGRLHQLDRSQFERRAMGEPGLPPMPVAQLKVQRRMRPEISSLIRTVYPNLEDHDSVKNLPSVVGMRDNLFWLDHDYPEDSRDDRAQVRSHSNPWEVSMAVALVRHLVRQGQYKSTDIALLTPYTGQLQKLRAALSKDFEVFLSDRDIEKLALDGFETKLEDSSNGQKAVEKKQLLKTIRLATVDNFQGEEAKIIVVSLVRSNNNCRVGFLRTENRINVLLSRAQHGMYLIGNTKTYRNVPMWADVHRQLSERDAVGRTIMLCCPRHPDTPIHCSEPEEFTRKSPEGGCTLICDQRLEPCGHRCPAPCHSRRLHEVFDCLQPCPRFRSTCQHPCPKLCGQDCGPCSVKVHGVKLPCGHTLDHVACHHTLDVASIRCPRLVEKEVPGCGHRVTVQCSENVAFERFSCPTECTELLKCGHRCPGSCGRCRTQGENGTFAFRHEECNKTCGRPYGTCNHRCSKKCHDGETCRVCTERCEVRCPHSRCDQQCQKPCAPCIEKCSWSCEHRGSCTLPCGAPCDRLPCDKRCTKWLRCGHQCPSFCGEECPQHLCQVCCAQGDARVDLMEFKTYAEINVDETPIAALACGHFFTGETLDGLVGMNTVYTADKFGNYNGLQKLSGALTTVPTCPDCRVPIRQFSTRRYNRVVNKAVLDETSKRFLVGGRHRLQELEAQIAAAENELSETRDSTAAPYLDLRKPTTDRYKTAMELDKAATRLQRDMDTKHQPTKKLLDAIKTFQRLEREHPTPSLVKQLQNLTLSQVNISPQPEPSYPPPAYDQQITLGAHGLQLRIQEAVLRDTFTLLSKCKGPLVPTLIPGGPPDKRSTPFLRSCKDLIAKASAANLPRLVIRASVAFARVAQLEAWYRGAVIRAGGNTGQDHNKMAVGKGSGKNKEEDRSETARQLLANALKLCDSFAGGKDCKGEVEETMRLFEGARYEVVSPEEIAAVKSAMVSGPGGIATHSGHWYHCQNGHPFAIGECGMPMERARCPECGADIGGANHQLLGDNLRDERMERA